MIGKLNAQARDVTIVGAGISGLLAAYYLDRAGYRVTVLEMGERPGGLISTQVTPLGLVEGAAHSLPATPAVLQLCADLGVSLTPIRPESRTRWIYRAGRPRRFPLRPFEALAALARAYLVLAPARDPESLTLEEWTRRFLGKKALRYLVSPFVRGIFGSSPSEISVSAAFPSLCVPRGHSLLSFLLAKWWRPRAPLGVRRPVRKFPRGPISAPDRGMQALTDALARRLEEKLGSRLRMGFRVESLSDILSRDNLILCIPAREAAGLLALECAELSGFLEKVRYSSLTTATVFVETRSLIRSTRGLGVLVPPDEGRGALGILYNSSAFPGRVTRPELSSLTMMFGERGADPESDEFRELVRAELDAILGLKGSILEIHARRWERAIPVYDAHLLKTWACAEKTWCARPGRLLFGNYTGQLSVRGMVQLAKELEAQPPH